MVLSDWTMLPPEGQGPRGGLPDKELRVWSGSSAPARSGRQQVHLVRLDGQRLGLPLLSDTTP